MVSTLSSTRLAVRIDGSIDDHEQIVISLTAVLIASAVAFVALRFFTRLRFLRAIYAEDWIILVALASFCAFGATAITAVSTTDARDYSALLAKLARDNVILSVTYSASIIAVKASISIFLLRIFDTKTWARYSVYACLAITVISSGAYLIETWISCQDDLSGVIDADKINPRCQPDMGANSPVTAAFAMIGGLTDLWYCFLSAYILGWTTWSKPARLSIIALFIFGLVGSIASCFRTAIWLGGLVALGNEQNAVEEGQSTIELGLYISIASMVALRPLVRHLLVSERRHSSSPRPVLNFVTSSVPSEPDKHDEKEGIVVVAEAAKRDSVTRV